MAFGVFDNIKETFTGAGSTTITKGGAAPKSRAFSTKFASGDVGWMTAECLTTGDISVGRFTDNGATITQTEVYYSSNGDAAVSFPSGAACVVYNDIPARVLDELNLKEITVSAAATSNIGAVHGARVLLSGSGATITSLGNATIDKRRFVRTDGINTLTSNSNIILPGGANITTAAGDTMTFLQDASGNWRCYAYQRAATFSADQMATFLKTGTAATGVMQSKVVALSRSLTAASGTVSYTGVGFKPSALFVVGSADGTASLTAGIVDSSGGIASSTYYGNNISTTGTGLLFFLTDATASNLQNALLSSFDSDGFTLLWTKSGSPTGTANLRVLCLR